MSVEVRIEQPPDSPGVSDVITQAFDDPTVALLWQDLSRLAGARSLVAVEDGAVVGHVGLSRGWVDARERLTGVGILSPLSVRPDRHRRGVGSALVRAAIDEADHLGWPALFLEGDPRYYARFGFQSAHDHGFGSPSPRIPPPGWQCVLLSGSGPGLRGPVVLPDTFWIHDRVGLRGELLERFGL